MGKVSSMFSIQRILLTSLLLICISCSKEESSRVVEKVELKDSVITVQNSENQESKVLMVMHVSDGFGFKTYVLFNSTFYNNSVPQEFFILSSESEERVRLILQSPVRILDFCNITIVGVDPNVAAGKRMVTIEDLRNNDLSRLQSLLNLEASDNCDWNSIPRIIEEMF